MLIANAAGWKPTIFYSPVAFCLFFAVLIAARLVSYHYFERPVQDRLRTWLAGGRLRPSFVSPKNALLNWTSHSRANSLDA